MPITWKNVAAPSFTGAAASLAGASTSFKNAGEALTAAFKGPLEDRRKAAEDARLEAAGMRQQEAHALAQQLGQYEVESARFDAENAPELGRLDLAMKQAGLTNAQATERDRNSSIELAETFGNDQFWDFSDPTQPVFKKDVASLYGLQQGYSPELVESTADSIFKSVGDQGRLDTAAAAQKQADALAIQKLKNAGSYSGGTGSYDVSGLEADTISLQTDKEAQADAKNLFNEFKKRKLPISLLYEGIDASLNFRGAFDKTRARPILENLLKKYKEANPQ